jgi:hypothetical protein
MSAEALIVRLPMPAMTEDAGDDAPRRFSVRDAGRCMDLPQNTGSA